ncbi:hypothetical protein BFS06_11415 [Clostridium perfringens]|uniref:DUF262 domain-containing protein n=1 Tax=Clostridium perfringens TaxID=1502 RepID=UPI00103AFC18|nr:DUF262 domain-containing protein [Clostridium perfringens]TBX14823.1 hypothetical protein BFS06_11415 [Clostridium perfringens]
MRKQNKSLTIKKLSKEYRAKRLDFELLIQRKDNIWDLKRKTRLINSILLDYPIPPVYSKTENINGKEVKHFLDGKQRLTTILGFINDEFKLDKNIEDYNEEIIAGKYFSQLSDEVKDKIMSHSIDVVSLDNVSDDEIVEVFDRLNNGVSLNNIEKTRPLMGIDMTQYLGTVCEHSFFKDKINISNNARNRYGDQEVALQSIKLIHEPESGLTAKDMQYFIKYLKGNPVKENLKSTLDGSLFYLNEAFPNKEKYLKKVNVPVLIKVVVDLFREGNRGSLNPEDFKAFCDKFFNNIDEDYKSASISGSAKKENVQKRYNLFKNELYKEFNIG